jgi:aminopeptidase N
MMKSWVEQAGYPIVTAGREGHTLRLQQQRFTYLPNRSEQQWVIPVAIRLFFEKGRSQQLTVLMEASEKIITIPADAVAYKINDRQSGFYRVRYCDGSNLEVLGRYIDAAILAPEDRWGLQNDLFALVETGDVSVDAYLQFLTYYDRETACLPLIGIVSNLSRLYLGMDAGRREQIGSWARPRYEAILSRIAYEPRKAETGTISILREQLIWEAALLGSPRSIAFGRERFAGLQKGIPVNSDLVRCVLQVAALSGNERVWDWLDQRFRHSAVEHERLNILAALGCFKDETLLKNTQRHILEAVPPRNKFIPVTAMAANPFGAPLMWDWYVSNLAEIEKFHPLIYERVIAAIVSAADIRRAAEIKAFFGGYMRTTDRAADVIKLSLEKLEIKSRLHPAG